MMRLFIVFETLQLICIIDMSIQSEGHLFDVDARSRIKQVVRNFSRGQCDIESGTSMLQGLV